MFNKLASISTALALASLAVAPAAAKDTRSASSLPASGAKFQLQKAGGPEGPRPDREERAHPVFGFDGFADEGCKPGRGFGLGHFFGRGEGHDPSKGRGHGCDGKSPG